MGDKFPSRCALEPQAHPRNGCAIRMYGAWRCHRYICEISFRPFSNVRFGLCVFTGVYRNTIPRWQTSVYQFWFLARYELNICNCLLPHEATTQFLGRWVGDVYSGRAYTDVPFYGGGFGWSESGDGLTGYRRQNPRYFSKCRVAQLQLSCFVWEQRYSGRSEAEQVCYTASQFDKSSLTKWHFYAYFGDRNWTDRKGVATLSFPWPPAGGNEGHSLRFWKSLNLELLAYKSYYYNMPQYFPYTMYMYLPFAVAMQLNC